GSELQGLSLFIIQILHERLQSEDFTVIVFQEDCRIFCLCALQNDFSVTMQARFSKILHNIQLIVHEQLNISVSFSIGNEMPELLKVHESFSQAVTALDYKIIAGKGCIMFYNDILPLKNTAVPFRLDVQEALLRAIRAGEQKYAEAIVNELFEKIVGMKVARKETVICMMATLITGVLHIILENNYSHSEIFGHDFDLYAGLQSNETLDDMRHWILNIIEKTVKYIQNQSNAYIRQFILHARKYIGEHHPDEELNLGCIAGEVGLSPCYLSLMFKKITGETVVEYITKVRIERAKELLKTTADKAYEIAYKVGFKDPHYFSACFKKIIGISPTEFRDRINFDI
ncbi:MAG: helix-turn-helix domain-containing protein, partial [Spirochaetota bacterium]